MASPSASLITSKVADAFADLHIDVEVQVDRRQMTLKQILDIEDNAVIKLPRSAGENMDILIGGAFVGHGEVVIIDDMVGIRITDFGEED
jgi:flagellar motor switch protein FliN/FliY